MLLKQQTKRQSFSIESLAVSSHIEHERNTDSPYLTYLAETRTSATNGSHLDCNSNVSVNWSQYQDYYSEQDEKPLVIAEDNCENEKPTITQQTLFYKENIPIAVQDYSTSTPKMPSPKRRRIDSSSTPLSSSDDSATDDKMVTDDSSVLSGEYLLTEKTSPASMTNSSVTSGKSCSYAYDIGPISKLIMT